MLLPDFFTFKSRTCRMIALAGMSAMCCASYAQEDADLSKYINQQSFAAVVEILDRGDVAYNKNDMKGAVEEYSKARQEAGSKILPVKFKQAVDERYAQALAQLGISEAVAGKVDIARPKIEEAFKIAPNAPGVKLAKEKIDDPKRINPAGTEKNAENVAAVNALLTKAWGFYDLGDFDNATAQFHAVLRLDPYNVASRRGLERVANAQMDYYKAAKDSSRAVMLDKVSEQWVTPLPPEEELDIVDGSINATNVSMVEKNQMKLNSLIVPRVNLDNVNLTEALDYVRNQSRRLDPENEGINIVADIGQGAEADAILARRFNIQMNAVPLSVILKHIASMSGTEVRPTDYSVNISSAVENSGNMGMRTFSLPPGFFNNSLGGAESSSDPFDPSGGSGLGVVRLSPKDFLEKSGVSFPEGAVVSYSASNGKLTVRNTTSNLNRIEDLVALHKSTSPTQVIIKATFVEVNVEKLRELGFEWIIGFSKIGGNAGRLFSGGSNQSSGDLPSAIEGHDRQSGYLTNGLRSGDQVYGTDSIDSLIDSGVNRNTDMYRNRKAPGIFSVRGVWSNLDIEVLMRGLDQKKDVDIMQQPQIIARPGETATFEHIREFVYPSDYTEPQIPSSLGNNYNDDDNSSSSNGGVGTFPVTPSHPNQFVTKKVGTTMTVDPLGISPDGTMVDLQIAPELVEFDGFVNYGNPIMAAALDENSESGLGSIVLSQNVILMPVFTKKGVPTKVTVASGHTVVLGGLMKSEKTTFEDKVPVLGDLPLVGRLFRAQGQKTEQKALIVMVRADIIDPSGQKVQSVPDDKVQ